MIKDINDDYAFIDNLKIYDLAYEDSLIESDLDYYKIAEIINNIKQKIHELFLK